MKILIVDDNEDFCENIKDILELHRHTLLTACNGIKALEIVENDQPQLVVMDIVMPRMDGVTALRKIRQIAPHLPVIVTTAFASDNLVGQALSEGAFAYLKKPLDFNYLFNIIREIAL